MGEGRSRMRVAVAVTMGAMALLPTPASPQFSGPASTELSWSPRGDLTALGAGLIGSIFLVSLDPQIRTWLHADRRQHSTAISSLAAAVEPAGSTLPQVASVGMMFLARISGHEGLTEASRNVTGALGFASGAAMTLKTIVGRARPKTAEGNPGAFFAEGPVVRSSGLHSFPSGHTTTAFALATAVNQEIGEHWPGRPRVVGPALYGAAALVGLSRIYDDHHWSSDVLMGAVLGTVISRSWVRVSHRRGSLGTRALEPILIRSLDQRTGIGLRWSF